MNRYIGSFTCLIGAIVVPALGMDCTMKFSLTNQVIERLALPIQLVLSEYNRSGRSYVQSSEHVEQVRSFLSQVISESRDQLTMCVPDNFVFLQDDFQKKLIEKVSFLSNDNQELRDNLLYYGKIIGALNTSVYIKMYARSSSRELGPSQERRNMLFKILFPFYKTLFYKALHGKPILEEHIKVSVPKHLETILESVSLTPQALAFHNKRYDDNGSQRNCDDDLQSLSSIALDDDETSLPVYATNRFVGVCPENLVAYTLFGTCLRVPSCLQHNASQIPVCQLLVHTQSGPTCSYHALANAAALKKVVERGQFPSSARIRHQASLSRCDMQSVYNCELEHSEKVSFFAKVLEKPYSLYGEASPEGLVVFSRPLIEVYDTVHAAVEAIKQKGYGMLPIMLSLPVPEKTSRHAVIAALTKPRYHDWICLYLDSNNLSLVSDESYAEVATKALSNLLQRFSIQPFNRCH